RARVHDLGSGASAEQQSRRPSSADRESSLAALDESRASREPGGGGRKSESGSQSDLYGQDGGGADQRTEERAGHDRRILRLPVTVLRKGRSDLRTDSESIWRQSSDRLEALSAEHPQGRAIGTPRVGRGV